MKMWFYITFIIVMSGPVWVLGQTEKTHKTFERAQRFFDDNRCPQAREEINKVIYLRPYYTEAYELRAMIHECLEDPMAAITDYSIILTQAPERVEALFSRAVARYKIEHYELAKEDFLLLLELPPQPTNKIYYRKNVSDEGFSGMSTLSTMHADVMNYLGLIYTALEEYDDAIQYYNQAIELENSPQFVTNLGFNYEKMGDLEKARDYYELALQIDPTYSLAGYNLMRLTEDGSSTLEDIASMSLLIESNERQAHLYAQRGYHYYELKRYSHARRDYQQAAELEPNNADHQLHAGMACQKLKLFDLAIAHFTRAIELNGNCSDAYFNRANTYFAMKKFNNALADYELSLSWDGYNPKAYYNKAMVLFSLDRKSEGCLQLLESNRLGFELAGRMFEKQCKANKGPISH